ncbi:MAG: hypothetical protein U9R75_09275, partial [Candidatus Thermoplasmatota archaeon]|nr:hypothetical protein [Candidatus Thermoplasmatota archaeon]
MGSGDVDRDGDIEIVFCDFEGNVILLEPDGKGDFDSLVIWQVEGPPGSNKTLFDLMVHDVDPDLPGVEIITAGDAGSDGTKDVYMISYDGTEWRSEVLFSSQFRIFDLEIGDIDPAPGEEIILSSFKHEEDLAIHYLFRSGASWLESTIPTTEAPKAVTVADADPNIPGPEVWACIAGWNDQGGVESHLIECYRDGSEWVEKIIYTNPNELIANVKIGDLWSVHPGNEVIIAELSGWCRYLYSSGSSFQIEDIFQAETTAGSSSGLEGLAIGEFNPMNHGEEAMVTGYYNQVTQIIEVDGELVSDLAWVKEVDNARLEISGVDVGEVTDQNEGNEILIASLQGWIEVLSYEYDGISLEAPVTEIEIDVGDTTNVFLEIVPRGLHSGSVVVSAEPVSGISLNIPSSLELQQQSILEVPVIVEVLSSFGDPRTVTLTFNAVSGPYSSSMDIDIDVKLPGGGDVQLMIEPPVGTIYQEGGATHISRFSVLDAEGYDYLEITSSTVEGIQIYANTPISPGQEQEITISVEGTPELGSHSISITASYGGLTVAQGGLIIEVVSMAESFATSVREVTGSENMYLAEIEFEGPREVNLVRVDLFVGDEKIYSEARDFSPGQNFSYLFSLDKDTEGKVMIMLSTLSDTVVRSDICAEVTYVPEESTDDDPIWVIIGVVVLIVLIGGLVTLFMFYKPSAGDQQEGDLMDIGSPSRYGIGKGPLGPRKVQVTGRLDGHARGSKVFDDIDRRGSVRRGDIRR